MGIRGGGKRDPRHTGKALGEAAEAAIFRAEVMSPLRYAMGLVDREKGDIGIGDHFGEAIGDGALRRHVEEIEFVSRKCAADRNRLVPRQ